jgi:3-phenylpropionate/trans-cinnamate dioxygenase ferredoxin subunit
VAKERVCSVSDVPINDMKVFECNGRSIALSNLDGEFHAIANLCTHDGGPLGEGQLARGRVTCPRHGAQFDARTGKVLTLPAVRDVKAYPVTVEGGEVYVDCDGE